MKSSAVTLLECGGNPLLHREGLSQYAPAIHDALGFEFLPQGLNRLVGQYREKPSGRNWGQAWKTVTFCSCGRPSCRLGAPVKTDEKVMGESLTQ
jgi:hypothetical protein